MNWGYFFAWVAVILGLFFVTGGPVSPELQGSWGNQYSAKSLTYYAVLYLHYLLGALFFTFLGLGMLRTVIWKGSGNNKQLILLLAWSVLAAAAVAVALTYQYAPDDNNNNNNNDDANDDSVLADENANNNTMVMDSSKDGNKTDL